MSGAACAKIIIDNYGALGGAAAAMRETGEASCEALMQLLEEDPALWEKIQPLTERACYWADEIDRWRKSLNAAVRELAESVMSDDDKNKE